MTTARLKIPYVLPSQAQKHVTVNEAFAAFDGVVQLSALSATTATPPASPTDGDTYVVATGGTGDWAGQDGNIAIYDKTLWAFTPPADGWLCYVTDEDQLYRYLAGWAAIPGTDTLAQLGINGAADSTNRLLVQSQGIVFNHVGSHQRTTVNKQAPADDAAFSFQTDFSPRALFGLLGSDDFTVKTSADGNTFTTGFSVEAATGNVSLGTVTDYSSAVTLHTDSAPEFSLITDAEDIAAINFCDAQAKSTQNCRLTWSAASNAFGIETNTTPALSIASNGTVSLPQAPTLSYSRDTDLSWGGNTSEKIAFETQRVLQGDIAINGAMDEITTPQAGTYLAAIRIVTSNGTTDSGDAWFLELRQNGTNMIATGTNLFCPNQTSGSGVEAMHSCTLPVIADTDDTFEVWVTSINSSATLKGAAIELVKIA